MLTFEIGKSYGGYTAESRTACFVTFQGQKRKKIAIVDGVESVKFNAVERLNANGQVIESLDAFTVTAIVDVAPVAPTLTELEFVGSYDLRRATATMSAAEAHALATPIKVIEPTFQEVADKAIAHGYTLINIASAYNPLPMYRLINTATGEMAHQFSMLCLADVVTWLDVKHQAMVNTVNTAFIAGQTYEAPGNKYTVTNRLGDSLELKNECGYTSTHNIHRDSNGEYIRPQLDSMKLYAADTPIWFYPVVKPVWYSLDDIEETRAQIRRELEQDIEDRDCDRAANFSMRGLV